MKIGNALGQLAAFIFIAALTITMICAITSGFDRMLVPHTTPTIFVDKQYGCQYYISPNGTLVPRLNDQGVPLCNCT